MGVKKECVLRHYFAVAAVAVLLSACDHFEEDKAAVTAQAKADAHQVAKNTEGKAMQVANFMRDELKRSGEQLRSWWITPLNDTPNSIPASYCYQAYQDILCYRQPMPGWEYRLVGYQGTFAAPPPVAMTEPLPVQQVDEGQSAVERVAAAQPVFVEMPPPVENKPVEMPDDSDAAARLNETLPDPALTPQL